jgi:hypothetical protein
MKPQMNTDKRQDYRVEPQINADEQGLKTGINKGNRLPVPEELIA